MSDWRPDAGVFDLPAGSVYQGRTPIKTAARAPHVAICLPVRKTSPVEFWLALKQMLEPLNTKLTFMVWKGADHPSGALPAEARNQLLQNALDLGAHYAFFLDDDVLFMDATLYRLLNQIRQHPEAAVISGVYPTKLDPPEPLIYAPEDRHGAYWDWPLGGLVEIDSAGAGCMIINLEYVRHVSPPWFNDVQSASDGQGGNRGTTGHDRYFMQRLRADTGGKIYADTGILLGHFDVATQRVYILPPESPCFQRAPVGEAYIPIRLRDGALMWRRLLEPDEARATPESFLGWIDWVNARAGTPDSPQVRLLPDPVPVGTLS